MEDWVGLKGCCGAIAEMAGAEVAGLEVAGAEAASPLRVCPRVQGECLIVLDECHKAKNLVDDSHSECPLPAHAMPLMQYTIPMCTTPPPSLPSHALSSLDSNVPVASAVSLLGKLIAQS